MEAGKYKETELQFARKRINQQLINNPNPIAVYRNFKTETTEVREKSVGTTELHYSTNKREHSLSILKAFLVRHSSEYETSDNDRKVNRNI